MKRTTSLLLVIFGLQLGLSTFTPQHIASAQEEQTLSKEITLSQLENSPFGERYYNVMLTIEWVGAYNLSESDGNIYNADGRWFGVSKPNLGTPDRESRETRAGQLLLDDLYIELSSEKVFPSNEKYHEIAKGEEIDVNISREYARGKKFLIGLWDYDTIGRNDLLGEILLDENSASGYYQLRNPSNEAIYYVRVSITKSYLPFR